MKAPKFILAPDSFKGTLSAIDACRAMKEGILRVCPGAEITAIPMADGGEGTVDAFLTAAGGVKRSVNVSGPFGEKLPAGYGIIDDGEAAVIEMASCAGLPLAGNHPEPGLSTTFGVGELIADAAGQGCKRIIVGLGGSCTNDGGTGAAAGAGARFYRADGNEFIPTGYSLSLTDRIDLAGLKRKLGGIKITAMCDIDNPLYGKSGAAYVFAPQKGADEDTVERLDKELTALDGIVQRELNLSLSAMPGAGAAGGMGFGMAAFFGAELKSGVETVLDTVHFDSILEGDALVFTGEGRLDGQSLRGKVISGLAGRTKRAGVPLVALVGELSCDCREIYSRGLTAAFPINRAPVPLDESAPHTYENIALSAENAARLFMAK